MARLDRPNVSEQFCAATASRWAVEVSWDGYSWTLWSQRDSERGAKIAAANARRSKRAFTHVRIREVPRGY